MIKKAPVIEACVRGYKLKDAFNIAWDMHVGDPVGLLREPQNPYDPNTVVATDQLDRPWGYIQRDKAQSLSYWMARGWKFTAKIVRAPVCNYGKNCRGIKKDSILVRCTPVKPTRYLAKLKEHEA